MRERERMSASRTCIIMKGKPSFLSQVVLGKFFYNHEAESLYDGDLLYWLLVGGVVRSIG